MRAISLPTALPVAAAALALVAAVLAPLAVPSTALAERWLRPVSGEVARPFDYSRAAPFAGGAHRGVDLAAAPGTAVRSACAGQVIHAGAVAGPEQVVSVRCGDRRVSYLPLATTAVEAGATVAAGRRLGTLAPGHEGLHFGVRRENDRFGYLDPAPLLAASEPPALPVGKPPSRPARPRPAPRATRPARPRPAPRATRPARPGLPSPVARPAAPQRVPLPAAPAARPGPARPRAAPRLAAWPTTSPRPVAGRTPSSIAPWPVWLGLAALLTGAVGSRTIVVRRRAARERATAAPSVQAG